MRTGGPPTGLGAGLVPNRESLFSGCDRRRVAPEGGRTTGAGPGGPALAVALALAGVLEGGARPLHAQQVTFSGHADPEVDRRITALLAGGGYRLLARDTAIGAGDTLRGPVLAAGIELRLDGVVQGDLVGVGSQLFLHPHAVVTGTVVNGGGGLYPSSLARLGRTLDRPLAQYTVTRAEGSITIDASAPGEPIIAWDVLHGLHIPTYDRVDGLWLQAGAGLRLPAPGLDSARLRGQAGWRTGGPGFTHTVDLWLRRGRYAAVVGEQRLTATPDRWIMEDLPNSAAFLGFGDDYRDYYDARRLFGVLARDFDAGAWGGHVALRAGREIDRALRTRDTWVLFEPDSVRPNPTIDEATIASVGAEAATRWTGPSASLGLAGEVELAGKAAGGDLSFGRYAFGGSAALQAIANHSLNVHWHVQGPLPGTSVLPQQRWSHVGGPATLPTFPIDTFPGDRVAYVFTEYLIPLPHRLHVPMLNVTPDLGVFHAAGMGWTEGQSHTLEQNLGVELRLLGLGVRVVTDPAHARSAARLTAGFSLGLGRISGAVPYFDTSDAER